MRTSNFTVEQIGSALRPAEGGNAVAEICRELGISEMTCCRWKQNSHGISTPELREKNRRADDRGRRTDAGPHAVAGGASKANGRTT